MLYYIIRDLLNFRRVNNDENLKAMVICFSSDQAKLANLLFNEVQEKVLQENPNLRILKQRAIHRSIRRANQVFKEDSMSVNFF